MTPQEVMPYYFAIGAFLWAFTVWLVLPDYRRRNTILTRKEWFCLIAGTSPMLIVWPIVALASAIGSAIKVGQDIA
jgi:hypothetical protein